MYIQNVCELVVGGGEDEIQNNKYWELRWLQI